MPYKTKEEYNNWKRKNYLKHREKELARKKRYHQTEKGRAVLYASIEKYRTSAPLKYEARLLVRAGVRNGRVQRMPCEICGKQNSHAHHEDYSRPYDVRWLCTAHHGEVHRKSSPTAPSSLSN